MATFRIVPERSAVVINATSSVHPITSRTDGLEGFVEIEIDGDGRIDVEATPRGQISLDVSRLKSGNPLEDRELRRRIDARRFRTIDGRMTELRATGEVDCYRVVGEITFKGVTKAHEDDMTFTMVDDDTLRLEGSTTFDVRDFGMEPPRILVLRVHPEVTVTLEAIATREQS